MRFFIKGLVLAVVAVGLGSTGGNYHWAVAATDLPSQQPNQFYGFVDGFSMLPSFGDGCLLYDVASDITYGDVVVFVPEDESFIPSGTFSLVKRVIAMPGDVVQMRSNVISVNGDKIQKQAIANSAASIEAVAEFKRHFQATHRRKLDFGIASYEETMPNGKRYKVMEVVARKRRVGDWEYDLRAMRSIRKTEVPAGYLYVLGDNRDLSTGSHEELRLARLDRVLGIMVRPVPIKNCQAQLQAVREEFEAECISYQNGLRVLDDSPSCLHINRYLEVGGE